MTGVVYRQHQQANIRPRHAQIFPPYVVVNH